MESSPEEDNINNDYAILEEKGEGATAIVYLVEDKKDKKQYAAKVLNEDFSLFEKEIDILKKVSALNCPYIINLINYGEGPVKAPSKPKRNGQYAILEYSSKGDLYDYIHYPNKGFSERHAKLIFHKILKGVQAIHKAGICHRDLKMENILVDDKFNPKINDFGYADEIKGELDKFIISKNYTAPEVLMLRKYEGDRVDIFSLGVVLFALVNYAFGFGLARPKDKYYRQIMLKKKDNYWDLLLKDSKITKKLTENFKNLYTSMINYVPKLRPSIDDILMDPWMEEVTSLDDKGYNELEKEVYEEFKKREIDVINNTKETINTNGCIKNINPNGNYKGGSDDDVEVGYFDLSLTPKYIQKDELNMNNYIKINGNLIPSQFMNLLANKIAKNIENNAKIEKSNNDLKFNAVFEEPLEDEEELDEELKKELDKLSLENTDELEEVTSQKDCVIQITLFQSLNGGYLVRFVKKEGEIEDYYKYLDSIKSIIKKIL